MSGCARISSRPSAAEQAERISSPLPVELVVAEREAGAVVDGRIVVDHRDLPARPGLRRVAGIVDDAEGSRPVRPLSSVRGCGRRGLAGCPGNDDAEHGAAAGRRFHRDAPAEALGDRLWMMCSPSPVPPRLRRVVKNGSKAWALAASVHADAVVGDGDLDVVRVRRARAENDSVPARPSGKAWTTALRNRLVSTWP